MRFVTVLALLLAVATSTVAARDTNANRLARGMPLLPPNRRGTGTDTADHHKPSEGSGGHGGGHGDGNNGNSGGDGHKAKRVARSLPAEPLARRGSGTETAEKHKPSKGHPGGTGNGGGHKERRALDDVEDYCRGVPVQCCSTITMVANPVTAVVASLLGATLPAVDVPVGLGCSPMTAVEDGWCNGYTVCCEDNDHHGIIAMDCTPVEIDG